MSRIFSVENLIDVAEGNIPADLVIKNCNMVNVLSGEIEHDVDVATYCGKIAGIGKYSGRKSINARGKYLCPGFLDAHIHIESSMLKVPEFTRAVVPHGTTGVVIDPHEIANVLGAEGILYMLKSSKYMPLDVYMMLPSCVPATNLETAGAELGAADLFPFLNDKWVLGLGELMNYPGVIFKDRAVMDKLKIMEGKMIDGHAPSLSGRNLCAYIAVGPKSDHECCTVKEAREKLRRGMHIMLREGSATRNLKDLLPVVNAYNSDRCMIATDDKHPDDLLKEGHIDHSIRLAISNGLDPLLAMKMATISTARYFGIENIGAIAPGYDANMVLLGSLKKIDVQQVLKNGRLVAKNNKYLYKAPRDAGRIKLRDSVNVKEIKTADLRIKFNGGKYHVIEAVDHNIITGKALCNPLVEEGNVVADIRRDILKIAVIERHRASGNIGLGLIKGFDLKKGAIASTVAHDSHNIVVIGTSDEEMVTAVEALVKIRGGLVAVEGKKIIASLSLPIAGLMSNEPVEIVAKKLGLLRKAARHLGSELSDPFITMSFMSLPVIPRLKLTDKGLVDVDRFKIIPISKKK